VHAGFDELENVVVAAGFDGDVGRADAGGVDESENPEKERGEDEDEGEIEEHEKLT